MTPKTTFQVLTFAVVAATAFFIFSGKASAQNVVLHPDAVSGEFTAKVNSATDDIRIERVCIYRIDENSPDPAAEVACNLVGDGAVPLADEEAPNFEGLVYNITFTTTLVPGENQVFVARNVATDIGGEIASEPSSNTGIIPGRPLSPVFIIVSPPAP